MFSNIPVSEKKVKRTALACTSTLQCLISTLTVTPLTLCFATAADEMTTSFRHCRKRSQNRHKIIIVDFPTHSLWFGQHWTLFVSLVPNKCPVMRSHDMEWQCFMCWGMVSKSWALKNRNDLASSTEAVSILHSVRNVSSTNNNRGCRCFDCYLQW